jgi:hypothetical protein
MSRFQTKYQLRTFLAISVKSSFWNLMSNNIFTSFLFLKGLISFSNLSKDQCQTFHKIIKKTKNN